MYAGLALFVVCCATLFVVTWWFGELFDGVGAAILGAGVTGAGIAVLGALIGVASRVVGGPRDGR